MAPPGLSLNVSDLYVGLVYEDVVMVIAQGDFVDDDDDLLDSYRAKISKDVQIALDLAKVVPGEHEKFLANPVWDDVCIETPDRIKHCR
ncbi:hypothetical protein MLD38_035464 [Melastoma candidum]|uniref:Uncharacterized protein n=1 Tax=Melastoma candidum TaxID=119954 RepID=A0ACB9LIF2_9MYRT|nr:hypothetical protein MLD38_035464 [Melastoma candidum]